MVLNGYEETNSVNTCSVCSVEQQTGESRGTVDFDFGADLGQQRFALLWGGGAYDVYNAKMQKKKKKILFTGILGLGALARHQRATSSQLASKQLA